MSIHRCWSSQFWPNFSVQHSISMLWWQLERTLALPYPRVAQWEDSGNWSISQHEKWKIKRQSNIMHRSNVYAAWNKNTCFALGNLMNERPFVSLGAMRGPHCCSEREWSSRKWNPSVRFLSCLDISCCSAPRRSDPAFVAHGRWHLCGHSSSLVEVVKLHFQKLFRKELWVWLDGCCFWPERNQVHRSISVKRGHFQFILKHKRKFLFKIFRVGPISDDWYYHTTVSPGQHLRPWILKRLHRWRKSTACL